MKSIISGNFGSIEWLSSSPSRNAPDGTIVNLIGHTFIDLIFRFADANSVFLEFPSRTNTLP
jgi:hypothetical protein